MLKPFSKSVDKRSKDSMVSFLKNHFRYHTLNSWNLSTSYAHNVKIYNLPLTSEQKDKLYNMLDVPEFYDRIMEILYKFAKEHNYYWQAGFNGKSGGYIVLYQGCSKPSEYKSYCTDCGQRNFKTVEETGNCRCGRCGSDGRINYDTPPLEISKYIGKPTDMNEDFEDLDIYELKKRTKLVESFDKMCDDIFDEVVRMLETYDVEEKVIYTPKTVKVLKSVS